MLKNPILLSDQNAIEDDARAWITGKLSRDTWCIRWGTLDPLRYAGEVMSPWTELGTRRVRDADDWASKKISLKQWREYWGHLDPMAYVSLDIRLIDKGRIRRYLDETRLNLHLNE